MADGVGDAAERTRDTATRTASKAFRRWRRWPGWIGYAAAAWSLVYGALGLYWALGGAGFPFGTENDPDAALSVLGGVQAETGAPVTAALGLAGAVAAVAMARRLGRGMVRSALLGFAWGAAAVLALLIPDYRVLVGVAYAPIILIGAPFGWPPGVSILDVFPWPVVNHFSASLAGSCGQRRQWPTGAAPWARAATAVAPTSALRGRRRTRRRGGGGGPPMSRSSSPSSTP